MEKILLNDILKEAKAKAEEYQLYHNYLEIDYQRNKKRIQNAPPKILGKPQEWDQDKKHNPFYVIKHASKIAKSVSRKILVGTYVPNAPVLKQVPKKGGGFRTVSVYQLQDSAVSDRFYHNLLAKNRHRFSSLSYAYRNDRNVHFAIQDIAYELRASPRIFIAEFDFSNFFGSIRHDYIFSQLSANSFLVSKKEEDIIKAFLRPDIPGVPQGTSISLFLANVICWEFDKKLEEEGLRFARYADDTIIWSRDYNKICKAFDIINTFSKQAGVGINFEKSDGISILQKKGMPSEFQNTKNSIDFLGYKISVDRVGIKDKSVLKIKKQISYLLYRNLIQPIRGLPFRGMNFPANEMDKDFLTAVRELRRFLYGNLKESSLRKYLNGHYQRVTFKGIMSFYPLIDDEDQLKNLDKWLVSTILKVLKCRLQWFHFHGYNNIQSTQFPFNLDSNSLIAVCKEKIVFRKSGDFEIPSFLRIYRAIKMGLTNDGIEKVMNPKSTNYNYE